MAVAASAHPPRYDNTAAPQPHTRSQYACVSHSAGLARPGLCRPVSPPTVHYHLNPATDYHFFRLQMPTFWVVRKMAVVFWALQSKELWHVELAQDGGTTNNPRAGPAGLVVSPDRGGSWR